MNARWARRFNYAMFLYNTLKKTPSPGKSLRSGNIGSKSVEFVVGSDYIVTLTYSLTKKDSIATYA